MKHVFIINPTSGKGKAYKQVEVIKKVFANRSDEFEILFTEYQGHATELTRRYRMSDDVVVYSVGGDGTAYEVLNGLQDQVQMAIIPAGTGNDYYRMMGYINKDLEQIILETVEGKTVEVDYGIANDRRFLNQLALGLDADANQVAQDIGKKLPIPRSLVYVISALMVMARPKRIHLEIEMNGEIIKRRALLMAIMNGRWYGGGFQPAPEASIQDGLFDICIVSDMSLFRILNLLPKYFKGTHGGNNKVEFHKASSLTLKTNTMCSVSCDGETSKQNSIKFMLVPKGLRLRVPLASTLE